MSLFMLTAYFYKYPPQVMVATWFAFFIPSFLLKHMLPSSFHDAHPFLMDNITAFTLSGGILMTSSLVLVTVASLLQFYFSPSKKIKAEQEYVQGCTYIEKDFIGRDLKSIDVGMGEQQEMEMMYTDEPDKDNELDFVDLEMGDSELELNFDKEIRTILVHHEVDLELGLGNQCPLEFVHSQSYNLTPSSISAPPSPPHVINNSDFDHNGAASPASSLGENSSFQEDVYESSECDLQVGKIPTFTLVGPTLAKPSQANPTQAKLTQKIPPFEDICSEVSDVSDVSDTNSDTASDVSSEVGRTMSSIIKLSSPKKVARNSQKERSAILKKLAAYARDNFQSRDAANAYLDAMV